MTGGGLCAALTSVAGSSAVVRGGLITYATDLKVGLAGVDAELIARHGVVSQPVAEAMAAAARRLCGADWGLAVTGVAGPGASDGVAAGTVWLGLAGAFGVAAQQLRLDGDRSAVRQATVAAALDWLGERLAASPQADTVVG